MALKIQDQYVQWRLVLAVLAFEQKMLVAEASGIKFHNLKLLYLQTIQ